GLGAARVRLPGDPGRRVLADPFVRKPSLARSGLSPSRPAGTPSARSPVVGCSGTGAILSPVNHFPFGMPPARDLLGYIQPVLYRRDAQRPGLPRLSGLRYVHPAHQRCPITPAPQFLFEFAQKPRFAIVANRIDVYLIDSRRPFVGLYPLPGLLQDVLPADLVVKKCEPPSGLLLGHPV